MNNADAFSFLPASIRSRIAPAGSCSIWTGKLNHDGYARVRLAGRHYYLHRLVYEYHHGRLPAGLEIDHLCRNRACSELSHLEAVTHQENVRRGNIGLFNLSKTHCPQGHPYEGDNVYWYRGYRACRICRRLACRRYNPKRTFSGQSRVTVTTDVTSDETTIAETRRTK